MGCGVRASYFSVILNCLAIFDYNRLLFGYKKVWLSISVDDFWPSLSQNYGFEPRSGRIQYLAEAESFLFQTEKTPSKDSIFNFRSNENSFDTLRPFGSV